ncbi:MAG: prolyl oligopeptidase family serine peptidase [Gemmatimonadaceae bacterium]|nr:prolyl oligopeptidase family serine peptidase [Gemmatimonadaceae bacterium]
MRTTSLLAALLLGSATVLPAQTPVPGAKKVLSAEDYARWRTIDNSIITADGKWVAYGLRFTNTLPLDAKPVLHLRNLATSEEIEVPNATQPAFSPDAKWIAYLVEPPPPARGSGRGASDSAAASPASGTAPVTPAAQPAVTGGRGGAAAAPPRRWELRELATGKVVSWQDVQSASFSPTSTHLLLRRRPTGAPAATTGADGGGGGRGGAGAAGGAVRASDAVLHELSTGRSQFLGSVGDIAFNRSGDLLAYTVDAAIRDGNGLFVVDLKGGRTVVLDNDSLRYGRLVWNDKGTSVAALKGRDVDKMRERDNQLIVIADVPVAMNSATTSPVVLNPAKATGFPKGFVVSDRAPLAWSEDGARVFLGIIPQTALPDTGRRRSTDSIADVDVWLTQDERVQSQQMIQIEADRNRTFRQAFDLASARYITLSDSSLRDLEMPASGTWAVGRDAREYVSDYKPPAADFYRVNTVTGERTLMLKGQLTGPHVNGISPDGRFFLYWKDAKWQSMDLVSGTSRTLGGTVNFTDMEEDHPGPKPSYGVAGYAADGTGVIAQHRFDLWFLPFDGTAARNLTNGVGTRDKIVHRYVRASPIDSSVRRAARVAREIDLSKPITLTTYGEYTKKAGFSRLANGAMQTLLYEDAAFSAPLRASASDVFMYTRQTFREFPDVLVSGADFANAKKISDANPQQAEFKWGRRILFDYTTRRGDKLQGILAIPDDYVDGEKRPMLVTFYEKNSQTMHRYPTPSFLTGMGGMPVEAVSRGYLTMLPDVQFHTGSSHSDMLDAVEAATKKVIAMGYADPKRIGVHGHSYGGEGAAFIGTRSRLFAAVGMGAGVTDLYSDFSQSWGWSYQVTGGSGQNGNGYYMNGQGRWGFSPWEKPEVYHFESALTHVPEVTSPFLIMHGTADPTVSFSEGMNFYNALRFNGKQAAMLAYAGEGHGLRGLANRRDLTTRYFEYFDHYLKGEPAPRWMTDGVPFIAKDLSKATGKPVIMKKP